MKQFIWASLFIIQICNDFLKIVYYNHQIENQTAAVSKSKQLIYMTNIIMDTH